MAEIKVEPKRGGLGWLWAIILIALLAAAAWYFLSNRASAPATVTPADSVRTSLVSPPAPALRASATTSTLAGRQPEAVHG